MDLKTWLRKSPIVAILRGITPREVLAIFSVLEEVGILAAEVPLNSPDPLRSIEIAVEKFGPRMLVGAGTVMDVDHARAVVGAGAQFIVTPHACPEVVSVVKESGLIALPGFATPTEAFAMLKAGADGLKLFPAESIGCAFLKALNAVLPENTTVIPVGGIDPSSIPIWKRAGASGYGVGSWLYKPGDSHTAVRTKALQIVASIK